MVRYTLRLVSKDRGLDLTERRRDIEDVFQHIHNGGRTGRRFRSLDKYQRLCVERDRIYVEVSESSKSWHPFVGQILANDCGMREYCDGKNQARMFKWQ